MAGNTIRMLHLSHRNLLLIPHQECILHHSSLLNTPHKLMVKQDSDLHFRQVLVDDGTSPSGVIDWVDVCRSDPAIDLSMLWSYLPLEGRETFLAEYGAVSDEQLLRARVIALSLSAALAHYGHHEGFWAVEREALSGLARAAAA